MALTSRQKAKQASLRESSSSTKSSASQNKGGYKGTGQYGTFEGVRYDKPTPSTPYGTATVLSPTRQTGGDTSKPTGYKYGSTGKIYPTQEEADAAFEAEQKIDTSQPSPETVDATAGLPGGVLPKVGDRIPGSNLLYEQADINNLKNEPIVQTPPGETFTQGQKYKQALANIPPGTPAPTTAGGAAPMIPQPDQPDAPSPVGAIIETDKNFDSILTNFDDWFSPPKQKQSLLQEYQSMSKALGIEDLNEELIDAKRIIEGTEDDIRAEVTAAGGFATDSQVLAMSNARNKSLIKNYNYLLESRDSAMTQLNTMMNLSMEDRKMAENEFDRKLNFAFKVQEFQERAQTNARNQFKYLIDSGFGSSLLQSPYETGLAEKALGLPSGGLANIVAQQAKDRALALETAETDLKVKKATLYGRQLENSVIENKINQAKNAVANGQLTPEQGEAVTDLTVQLRNEPSYKEMFEIRAGYNTATVGYEQNNGFGDIAMVNGYQRMIDPGATVRGEDVKTQAEAVAYMQRVLNIKGRVMSGDRFTEETRTKLKQAADDQYSKRVQDFDSSTKARYEKQIDRNPLISGLVSFDDIGDSFKASEITLFTPEIEQKAESLNFDLQGSLKFYSPEEIIKYLNGQR